MQSSVFAGPCFQTRACLEKLMSRSIYAHSFSCSYSRPLRVLLWASQQRFERPLGDLVQKINRSGRTSSPDSVRHRLGTALVITALALSFVMLMISGLLVRSFLQLVQVDPGFDETKMLTVWLSIPQNKFSNPEDLGTYLDEILQDLAGLPGVHNAAFTAAPPLVGWGYGMAVLVRGRPDVDTASRPIVGFKTVSPSYFDT